MDVSFVQFALLLFVAAIAIVAYEMQAAFKPATCPECAHCRSERKSAQHHDRDVRDFYRREYGWRDSDDQDR